MPNMIGGVAGAAMPAGSLQQTRHARRLYVGGVEATTEIELQEFFANAINLGLGEPVDLEMALIYMCVTIPRCPFWHEVSWSIN